MKQPVGSVRALCLLCFLVLMAACERASRSFTDDAAPYRQPLITDATHGQGTVGFIWLPPIVPRPALRGPFASDLAPVLHIDEIDPATRANLRRITTFSRTAGPRGERLRVRVQGDPPDDGDADPVGYFVARWRTAQFDLAPTATYRLRAVLDDRELGVADVRVVASAAAARAVDRTQYVPVRAGETLRIKFRVERSAVACPSADDAEPAISPFADGQVVAGNRVDVSANFTGPLNTGVTVNGWRAVVLEGRFLLRGLELEPGENSLITVGTTVEGELFQHNVTVTSLGTSTWRIERGDTPGNDEVPAEVSFRVGGDGSPIAKIEADFDEDCVIDAVTTDPSESLSHRYERAGWYTASFTVTDTNGARRVFPYRLALREAGAADAVLGEVFSGMTAALGVGDIEHAARHLDARARAKYVPVFETLAPSLGEIVASFSPPSRVSLSSDFGEYAVVRPFANGQRLYLVSFLRDAGGVWRVGSL
jgi:hypothetical protein